MNDEYNFEWLEKLQNNEISKDDFDKFQDALRKDPELRKTYRQFVRMNSHLSDMAEGQTQDSAAWNKEKSSKGGFKIIQYSGWLAAAAVLVIALVLPKTVTTELSQTNTVEKNEETSKGVAIITESVNVKWKGDSYQTGQAVGLNPIEIEEGVLKIEFYCGAAVILQGPAKLEPVSAWKAICHSGKLRANVPPAARGFTVQVDDTDVVDLGTNFAIDANGPEKKIQVFEGEVELNSPKLNKHSITTGKSVSLDKEGNAISSDTISQDFMSLNELKGLRDMKDQQAYSKWLEFSNELTKDSRLIAYYNFTQQDFHRRVLNNLTNHGKERSGAIVGADREDGRWQAKSALSFKQPGDRVRIHIPGEYKSLTFMCWVKIYSLDHDWNSLYLTDNYQVGENHWQIMRDGRLMFSTKIRDKWESKEKNHVHIPNFSPSFWNPELRGKWVNLAVRLDVENKAVTHFFNGKALSHHPMQKHFIVTSTRFGNGEIGNWGLPNKPDESYAIRNLNGAIDEFAIFSEALSDEEILNFYEVGNPYK
ncbi:MAG: LamG domain-containing protein [Lentisphaeraceae bacterium]|nr:LamG domain-containing protein [Lentisphaeraceae bacterium]